MESSPSVEQSRPWRHYRSSPLRRSPRCLGSVSWSCHRLTAAGSRSACAGTARRCRVTQKEEKHLVSVPGEPTRLAQGEHRTPHRDFLSSTSVGSAAKMKLRRHSVQHANKHAVHLDLTFGRCHWVCAFAAGLCHRPSSALCFLQPCSTACLPPQLDPPIRNHMTRPLESHLIVTYKHGNNEVHIILPSTSSGGTHTP